MNHEKNKNPASDYLTLLLCFFLDVLSFAYFERPIMYSQLGFFVLNSFTHGSYIHSALAFLLMLITNFFYQGRVLLALAYVLPTTVVLIKRHRYLDSHPIVQYVLTFFSLTLFCLTQSIVVHGTVQLTSYTFIPIPVTLLIMLIISLI